MTSPFYDKVVGVISPYIGAAKANTAVDRQLARCGATADTFAPKHFGEVVNYVVGASIIWLGQDADKRSELAAKLRALG